MSSSHRRSIDSLDAYPFPGPEGSTRRPGVSRPRQIRGDFNASISTLGSRTYSVGGSLDIRPLRADGMVREIGQNAISTLLQPPIVRTGLLPHVAGVTPGYRPPTSRDIPPVTLTNIPHVEPTAFKDYLAKIGPLFDSIARRKEEAEGKTNESNDSTPASPAVERRGSYGTPKLGSAPQSPVAGRPNRTRRSSGGSRRKANEPSSLSTVPTVYFDDDFHLENPRTFDVVSERAEIVRSTIIGQEKLVNGSALPPRKALATNAILQEKLSWYMDTVEVHLINSISEASGSFFEALGSLRNLQKEAEECASKIQDLRSELARLDRGLVMGGLDLSRLRTRRRNIDKLCKATAQVQRVIENVAKCEEQVDEGTFENAANGLEAADKLVCGQADLEHLPVKPDGHEPDSGLIDLREVKILHTLTPIVHNLHGRIGRGFETTFLKSLLDDLRGHVNRVPMNDTLKRWASASQRYRPEQKPARVPTLYLETVSDLRAALSSSLEGLDRAGYTGEAANAFRNAVMKEMKALIRKHLPSSSDEDAESVTSVATRTGLARTATQQEKSAALARNLRALDEEDAEALLFGVVANVSEALRRLGVQVKVLLDVTSNSDRGSRATSPEVMSARSAVGMSSIDAQMLSPTTILSPLASPRLPPEVAYSLDMSAVSGQAVDVAQIQLVRVLKVRSEQTSKLPLERFVRYYTVARFFADECEAISGSPGQALISAINTQLASFISHMAEFESQRMAQQLESDQWEAQDFLDKDQTVLQRLLDGMSSDPPTWTKGTIVWEKASTETNGVQITNGTASKQGVQDSKKTAKPAYIDDTRFILVKSATILLSIIDDFCSLAASVPGIVPTVISGMMDVLRTFNSRSSQLILGAGATRVAGLKNITTKHLALSSQALSFVVALIPYIREAMKRHAKGRNEVLMEFDKIKRLFQDHQMGISDKLVDIMTARARSHVSALKKMDFDTETSEGPSAYMETLTKETGTLYRVLNRHLSEGDLGSIMNQISKNYREIWISGFAEADAATEKGKSRLRKDAELFESRLSKIAGFDAIGKTLLESVDVRKVQQPPAEEVKPVEGPNEVKPVQEPDEVEPVQEPNEDKPEERSEAKPREDSKEVKPETESIKVKADAPKEAEGEEAAQEENGVKPPAANEDIEEAGSEATAAATANAAEAEKAEAAKAAEASQ